MVILTWNLAGRVARLVEQATAIAETGPDVVALQEVRHRVLPDWIEALRMLGHRHVVASRTPGERIAREDRVLDVLIASRWPVVPLAGVQERVVWPERLVAGLVDTPHGPVEVYCAHAPTSMREDRVKVRFLEALAAELARPRSRPRVLAGDLNTPREEFADGTLTTFAVSAAGVMRPDRGERHDDAERGILRVPGFVDAVRAVLGFDDPLVSWSTRPESDKGGYRLDHVLATPELTPVEATYETAWRRRGLSDHSGLHVRFAP